MRVVTSSSLRIATWFTPTTKTMPFCGSAAVVPQFEPPWLPGIEIVSVRPGGVKMPSLRIFATRSRMAAYCSGDGSQGFTSSTVNVWRANGGGLVGKGCVGQDCSPGTSLCGTGRSSIGQSGSPVTRSKTYRKPVLPACATASTLRPLCRTVTSCGAETLSKSHRSWWTVWKCQSRLPVRASSARRQFAKRFWPVRSAP